MSATIGQDIQVDDRPTLERVLGEISFVNTSLDFRWQFEVSECNDPARPAGSSTWLSSVRTRTPARSAPAAGASIHRQGSLESGVVKTAWLLVELVVRHELMESFSGGKTDLQSPQ